MQRVRVSSVSIVTGLRPARAGCPGSIQGTGRVFSAFHIIHTALGPTQRLSGNPSPVVKLLGFEANHSPAFRAYVKNVWRNISISSYVLRRRCSN